jgi:serine/threonine protein kinase
MRHATATPHAGGRFAGFELKERVGEGGIGLVYRARDLRLGREVALRIIGAEIARDAVTRARLNRESLTLASVDHPNVVPIYDAGESDGRLYVVTRWVDGVDLGTLVHQHGPLVPRRAVRIVNQVASALQAAHDLGIMHRSVRPSSVLVTETDHAYLTDFGLARRASDLTGLTMQEHLLESFDYLAPEYIEGAPADKRVDIYGSDVCSMTR